MNRIVFSIVLCSTLHLRTNADEAKLATHSAITNVTLLVFETDVSDESAALLVSHARAAGITAAAFGQGEHYNGFGTKYASLLPHLEVLADDTLVVIADARDVLLNVAVQNASATASATLVGKNLIDLFLATCQRAKLSPHETVVASAEHQCCVGALTYIAPGEAFDSKGGRSQRTCWSGKEGCTWNSGGETPWIRAMDKVALDHLGENKLQSAATYLNAGLMAGTAAAWLQVISEIQITDSEDDQALLTAYMIDRPGRILLDYDGGIFGANRWPLGPVDGCMYEKSKFADILVHKSTRVQPVFVHSPGKLYECHDQLSEYLGQKPVQRSRRVASDNYGNNYGNTAIVSASEPVLVTEFKASCVPLLCHEIQSAFNKEVLCNAAKVSAALALGKSIAAFKCDVSCSDTSETCSSERWFNHAVSSDATIYVWTPGKEVGTGTTQNNKGAVQIDITLKDAADDEDAAGGGFSSERSVEVKSNEPVTKEFIPTVASENDANYLTELVSTFEAEPNCEDNVCCNANLCASQFGETDQCCTNKSYCRSPGNCFYEPTFEWEYLRGCCRKDSTRGHDDTTPSWVLTSATTRADATANCKETCANDDQCTAFEIIKKSPTTFRCELHVGNINSAARKSKSCKNALCTYKKKYRGPSVCTPSVLWNSLDGCCRAGITNGNKGHDDTTSSWVLTATTRADATANCTETCANDDQCTAFELIKKSSATFKCELHVGNINAAARKSKSCKNAQCSFKVGTKKCATKYNKPIDTSAPTVARVGMYSPLAGCCREDSKKGHEGSSKAWFLTSTTLADAQASCTETCTKNPDCTAFELIPKDRGTFRCEQHTATINSASQTSRSCVKAQCQIKTGYENTPIVTPMSAPTTAPTVPPLIEWVPLKGCCRHQNGANSSKEAERFFLTMTTKVDAEANCKYMCAINDKCSAYELLKKDKAKFKCELHDKWVNSASTANRSCKQAACVIKGPLAFL